MLMSHSGVLTSDVAFFFVPIQSIIFLLKIRHENNTIALASPNF